MNRNSLNISFEKAFTFLQFPVPAERRTLTRESNMLSFTTA